MSSAASQHTSLLTPNVFSLSQVGLCSLASPATVCKLDKKQTNRDLLVPEKYIEFPIMQTVLLFGNRTIMCFFLNICFRTMKKKHLTFLWEGLPAKIFSVWSQYLKKKALPTLFFYLHNWKIANAVGKNSLNKNSYFRKINSSHMDMFSKTKIILLLKNFIRLFSTGCEASVLMFFFQFCFWLEANFPVCIHLVMGNCFTAALH